MRFSQAKRRNNESPSTVPTTHRCEAGQGTLGLDDVSLDPLLFQFERAKPTERTSQAENESHGGAWFGVLTFRREGL